MTTAMTPTNEPKSPSKPTGKRYASVADLMRGEDLSKEVVARVGELESETRITKQLACMRAAVGLTQAQMAERLEVTQGCISKWESGQDEELTIRVLRMYCQTTGKRIGLIMGKPMKHVEAVKAFAMGLRDRLKALAAMAHSDGEMERSIQAFFGEAFFNLLDIFENCQRDMPDCEDFEIRLDVQGAAPKRIRPMTPPLISA